MTGVIELRNKLHKAWSRETSYIPEEWSEQNPSRGQCAVTALLVQEYMGGNIVKCNVVGDVSSHFYNMLENGEVVDFTREQFGSNFQFTDEAIVSRASVMHPKTEVRYKTLKEQL